MISMAQNFNEKQHKSSVKLLRPHAILRLNWLPWLWCGGAYVVVLFTVLMSPSAATQSRQSLTTPY